MKALEDESVLDDVLGGRDDGVDVIVVIGEENAAGDLSGVSVIASAYGRGEGEGIVAVIGPTRMDYSRVIRAVRAARLCAARFMTGALGHQKSRGNNRLRAVSME